MDLSFFLTTPTATSTSQNSGVANQNLTGNEFLLPGFLFNDILLSKIADGAAEQVEGSDGEGTTPVENTALQIQDAVLALQAAIQDYQTENSDEAQKDLSEAIIDMTSFFEGLQQKITLSTKVEQLETLNIPQDVKIVLKNLLKGLPLSSQTSLEGISDDTVFANTEATLNKEDLFERILQNLTKEARNSEIPVAALIVTGLTPQQLSQIEKTGKLADVLILEPAENKNNETDQDLLNLLGIVQTKEDFPLSATLNSGGLVAVLSGLNLGGDGGAVDLPYPLEKFASNTTGNINFTSFKAQLVKGEASGYTPQILQNNSGSSDTVTQPTSFNNSFSTLLNFFETGDLSWFDPSTLEWAPGSTMPSALNGSSITSVVTQSPHAATPHPATQMVSVSLQKNAAGKESQNWTLQLDPPDLGKVEVRLTFTKDKPVKAVLMIEKPETFLMLQRDAQILERSLQDAGLDTANDSLSFELAQDNEFSNGGRHEGQDHAGQNNAADEELEIIETTMNWYVDPETGVQRYNLIV